MTTIACLVGGGHHFHADSAEDGRRVLAASQRKGKVVALSLGECGGNGMLLEGYLRFGPDGKLVRRGPEYPNYIRCNVRAFLWKPRTGHRETRRKSASRPNSLSEPDRREVLDTLGDPECFRSWVESGPSLL